MGLVGVTTLYPYQYHPIDAEFSGAWHSDYSVDNPSYVAATMAPTGGNTPFNPQRSGYTTDGGYSWTQFPTRPLNTTHVVTMFGAGSIHVGQPGHIIWVSSYGHGTYRTTDHGATWTAVSIGLVTMSSLNGQAHYFYRRPIASEKVAGSADTFYCHAPNDGVFVSTDVGATWTQVSTATPFAPANWGQHAYIKAVPGHAGHLFDTPGYQGTPASPNLTLPFLRSTDGGATWTAVHSLLKSVRGFDFGKAAPGQTYPAIYVVGVYNGVAGVYRSDDNAATWVLLSTQPHDTVDFIRNVGASKETYGKHWITTQGSGLIVGTLS
jgi:photosystem II stability/assembly factor-like uncharacterized protein